MCIDPGLKPNHCEKCQPRGAIVCVCVLYDDVCAPPPLQYMPAAAAAPMQGTYIPQYTAVPASAITVEVRTKADDY